MNQKPRLSEWGRALLLLPCLMTAVIQPAKAQRLGPLQEKFVAGEVVLYMQPGTPLATAQAVAAKVNPSAVVPLMLQDCYKLVLQNNKQSDLDAINAVATLKQDPSVRWAGRNSISYPLATTEPNDPKYKSGEQWGLKQINMPQAWTLTKGTVKTNLAVVDTGFYAAHEDLTTTYLVPGSFDTADNDSDFTADAQGTGFDHGTNVTSIAAAHTNNALGMAGVIWQGSKIVAVKACKKGGPPSFPLTDLVNAYTYVATNNVTYGIKVLNLSLGGPGDPNDTSDPRYVALKAVADKGILVVVASGNGGGNNATLVPSGYSFVFTVSSTDPQRKVTGYSDTGKIDVGAPGGNSQTTGNAADGITVANNSSTSGYGLDGEDGTSFASPHAAAVATLLMGMPNMTSAKAIQILHQGANKTGLSVIPDPKLGYGVLDAYQALLRVSVSVDINAPDGVNPNNPGGNGGLQPAPLETLKPVMSFTVSNVPTSQVQFVIDPGPTQIAFSLNQVQAGTVANVSEFTITGDTTSANPQYTVTFRYSFTNAVPFSHTIQVTATNTTTGTSATDTRSFNIAAHVIPQDPSGVVFVSIPYFESQADKDDATKNGRGAIIDNTVTLYRWLNTPILDTKTGQPVLLGGYSVFGNGNTDPQASLTPTAFVPTIDGAPSTTPPPAPLGVAYFLKANGPIPYVTYGQGLTNTAIRIPLHEGWNMIGDPFPFSVAFNSILVEKQSGERLTVQAAVDGKLMLPHIYQYSAGEYTFKTLPDGNLQAWQGQWLYVLPRDGSNKLKEGTALTLIVPPAGIQGSVGRAAAGPRLASTRATTTVTSTPRVTGNGSWAIRLEANSRNLKDSYNYIGMSSRATMGDDFTKVPKPPKPSPYLTLGMTRPDSSLGMLAQDLQPVGGVRTWNVQVTTDQPNTDITVTWPDIKTLPRNYNLTLTDTVNGQSVNLRNTSSYQFNSGHNAATRSFTLTATPANIHSGTALITNIFVNPGIPASAGRASTPYEIGYTVSQDVRIEASILGFNGHVVSNLGPTRAATSGNNKIVWNGLDNNGHAIPAGSYLLQLRAITTDGQVTRQVAPLVISGR